MADDGGVLFTSALADRILRAVDHVEAQAPGLRAAAAADSPPSGVSQIQHARVTSGTANAGGYYPAVITQWQAASATWLDFGAVSVRGPNAEALTSGTNYAVRPVGVDPTDGVTPAYQVCQGAGFVVSAVAPGTGDPSVFSLPGITEIQFREDFAFVVTNVSPGVAKVGVNGATATHAGLVTTGTQQWAGDKGTSGAFNCSSLFTGAATCTEIDLPGDAGIYGHPVKMTTGNSLAGVPDLNIIFYSGTLSGFVNNLDVGYGFAYSQTGIVGGSSATIGGFDYTFNTFTIKGDLVLQTGPNYAGTTGKVVAAGSVKAGTNFLCGAALGVTGTGGGGDTVTGGIITALGGGGGGLTVGTTAISGGSAFGVLYNNGGTLANVAPTAAAQIFLSGSLNWVAVSGDATISTAGALTVTKTNGVAFAASATTDATNAANISSGTLPAGRLPNPSSSTLGGVQSAAAVSHQWVSSISTAGVPALTQPAFSDISGTASNAQLANSSVTVTAGTGLSGGGAVSLGGAITLSLPNVGTAGTYGDGTHVSQITTDAQGRVSAVTAVAITGAAPTGSAGGDLTGTYPNPTLAAVGTAGTYGQVTTDSKGRVTAGATCDAAHGGTGLATLTAHAVLLGEGTAAVAFAAPGTAGQVLTSNGASADPTFQAVGVATWPPRYISGLNLAWSASTLVTVAAGQAVDSANATNITLASVATIDLTTTGSLQGVDSSGALAGTVSVTSGLTTVTGVGTSFSGIGWLSKNGIGTITNSGTACVGVGTSFLSQIAVNDLIGVGNVFQRVVAVADDTHLTLAATFAASAVAFNVIEQPTIKVGANVVRRVVAIASATSLTIDAGASATQSTTSHTLGNRFLGDGTNNAYLIAWLLIQSGVTGVVLSTQRTAPYATNTAHRRLKEVILDTAGGVICFKETGGGPTRRTTLIVSSGGNNTQILSGGSSTTLATVTAWQVAPPTAERLILQLYLNNPSATCSMGVGPANTGTPAASFSGLVISLINGQVGTYGEVECDGAQNIQYKFNTAAGSCGNIYSYGWDSTL